VWWSLDTGSVRWAKQNPNCASASGPIAQPAHHAVGLTVAARRLAEAALEELGRFGGVVTLDEEGKARFCSIKALAVPD
jgi:hypothetical protein